MTLLSVQLSMLGMEGKRRPSTPTSYRDEFIARVRAARIDSGKSQRQIALEIGVSLTAYQSYETRYYLPHHKIIPFCVATGIDHYYLLTGVPFSLGRTPGSRPRPTA